MATVSNILKIGDRIELLRIDSYKDETTYPSQVLDILDDEMLVISGPIYKNHLVNIRKNEKIRIICMVKDRGKYMFDAEILNIENENIYRLKIKRISEITKQQLRKFFRMDISLPVVKYFTIVEKNNERTLKENCRTKDISGGGMKLYSNYEHKVDDIITCEFKLDDQLITVKARVVRISKVDVFGFDFSLGVEFIDINEKIRDYIIQYLFSKQRKLREKGMI